MTKALDKALSRALAALRRPDAKLVRLHGGTAAGFWVELPHNSFRVPDGVAAKLLVRGDVQPFDSGLPGFDGPQSWKLGGNWREWSQRDPMMPVVSMMPAVVNVTEQTVSRVTTALTDGVGDITQDLLRFKANQFHTVLADPPWRFVNRTGKVAPEHGGSPLPTMTLEEICALPVAATWPPRRTATSGCPNALLARRPRGDGGLGLRLQVQHRLAQGPQGRRLRRPRRRLLLPQRHRAHPVRRPRQERPHPRARPAAGEPASPPASASTRASPTSNTRSSRRAAPAPTSSCSPAPRETRNVPCRQQQWIRLGDEAGAP